MNSKANSNRWSRNIEHAGATVDHAIALAAQGARRTTQRSAAWLMAQDRKSGKYAKQLRARAETQLEDAQRAVTQAANQVRKSGLRIVKRADGAVKRRPWTGIASAAALGLALGAIAVRR